MRILCGLVAAFLLAVTAKGVAVASVEYFYAKDGTLTGRAVNGKHQFYEYDRRGQLLAVKDTAGRDVERYTYDPAGNILSKYVNGVKTTYTYDKANQLVSSTVNGKPTTCEYDAAGRLIREGNKTYKYGYPDKVMAVHENGKEIASFDYHIDGRIASAKYGDRNEEFLWDGLALIHRSGNDFINEPYVTGGNPILSSKDGVMFNDMLGNTLNIGGKSVSMTAFGETADTSAMFTGKPYIGELGYAFLFRNYRAEKGKWQTTDPLGYPDGWNNLAYCNNILTDAIDFIGTKVEYIFSGWQVVKTIGLNGSLIQSGIQGGYSVMILWESSISYTCSDCKHCDSKKFYDKTTYSIASNGLDSPVWTAPSTQMIQITADNILSALGVPTVAVSLMQELADSTVANNVPESMVHQQAYSKTPARPENPQHICE